MKSEADRFVMGLLRSCADTIVIGAGTFRRAPKDVWRAEAIYPAAGALFAELRTALGLKPRPRFVIVSASGQLDVTGPAIPEALIVTNATGARSLGPRLPIDDGAPRRRRQRNPPRRSAVATACDGCATGADRGRTLPRRTLHRRATPGRAVRHVVPRPLRPLRERRQKVASGWGRSVARSSRPPECATPCVLSVLETRAAQRRAYPRL